MYAVKTTNLHSGIDHYTAARSYSDACDRLRAVHADLDPAEWEDGTDYMAEIVEVDDDFDFDAQADWN